MERNRANSRLSGRPPRTGQPEPTIQDFRLFCAFRGQEAFSKAFFFDPSTENATENGPEKKFPSRPKWRWCKQMTYQLFRSVFKSVFGRFRY
jgi:hypothetical protein